MVSRTLQDAEQLTEEEAIQVIQSFTGVKKSVCFLIEFGQNMTGMPYEIPANVSCPRLFIVTTYCLKERHTQTKVS